MPLTQMSGEVLNQFTESKGVTAVIVSLNNSALACALVRRRILKHNLFAILFSDLEGEDSIEMIVNKSHSMCNRR